MNWLPGRAVVRIGDRGILHRGLGWGWIPWDEIEGAYPPAAGEGDVLRLKLRLTERLERVLGDHAPALVDGVPRPSSVEVRLDLTGTAVHPADLLLEILARGPQALRGADA
jgi:hypothetical protein